AVHFQSLPEEWLGLGELALLGECHGQVIQNDYVPKAAYAAVTLQQRPEERLLLGILPLSAHESGIIIDRCQRGRMLQAPQATAVSNACLTVTFLPCPSGRAAANRSCVRNLLIASALAFSRLVSCSCWRALAASSLARCSAALARSRSSRAACSATTARSRS